MIKKALISISLCFFSVQALAEAWVYTSVLPLQWEESMKEIDQGQGKKWMEIGYQSYEKKEKGSPEGLEGLLIAASAAKSLKLPLLSYLLNIHIVKLSPGSQASFRALQNIDALTFDYFYDDEELARMINQNNFGDGPESIQPMRHYYFALDAMKKKQNQWILDELKKIDETSVWGRRMKYLTALNKLKNNDQEAALADFDQLMQVSDLPSVLSMKVRLQKARIHFERKEFEEAEKIYSQFLFPGREFGKVLLERAWIRFYQRDFATALGILEALKSPFFDVARTPEQYILGLLIYRELCHFQTIAEKAKEFEKIYGPVIQKIQKREPFHQLQVVMWITLSHGAFAQEANLVHQARTESKTIEEMGSKKSPSLQKMIQFLKKKEKVIQKRLAKKTRSVLKVQAEKILDSNDQVKFIEYVSQLDQYRVLPKEDKYYEAEKVQRFSFDRLYWPVQKEYWWDEVGKYRMLVNDQCGGNP